MTPDNILNHKVIVLPDLPQVIVFFKRSSTMRHTGSTALDMKIELLKPLDVCEEM